MQTVDEALSAIAEEADPRRKWLALERAAAAGLSDARIDVERLWWNARYAFTDRKRTLVRDHFVWVMVAFTNWERGRMGRKNELADAYRDVFEAPAMTAAIAADDRLCAQVLAAAEIYAETYRQSRGYFGFSFGDKTPDQLNTRVASELTAQVLVPMARHGADLAHIDLLMRAVWQGAQNVYPGILPRLRETVADIPDEALRARVRQAVQNETIG